MNALAGNGLSSFHVTWNSHFPEVGLPLATVTDRNAYVSELPHAGMYGP